jgi:predicted aspartyl protease
MNIVRDALAVVTLSLAMLSAPSSMSAQASAVSTNLDALLADKDYPKLERTFAAAAPTLSSPERDYFSGVLANRLNQARSSLQLLEPLLPGLLLAGPDRAEAALCAVADDYAKLYRYSDAAATYARAAALAHALNMASTCSAARGAARWSLLKDMPPQAVEKSGPSSLTGSTDNLGLLRVPVTIGGGQEKWILDTGANLSVIRRSAAERLGLRISNGGSDAESATGAAISVRVALIPELHVGSAVLRNVPVLVAEDSDLNFASIDYQIDGCLGLPVLAALGSVTVSQDGSVNFGGRAAESQAQPGHNLFFERFTPVIVADAGEGEQLFTVDTGAMGTMLSAAFYEAGNGAFDAGELRALRLVGAGSVNTIPAYELNHVNLTTAGRCAMVGTVELLLEKTGTLDEFYGNIGQNVLRLFGSYTFDFQTMQFSVTGGSTEPCAKAV